MLSAGKWKLAGENWPFVARKFLANHETYHLSNFNKSNQQLIFPYSNTARSNTEVVRNKGIISKWKKDLSNKFSRSAPQKVYVDNAYVYSFKYLELRKSFSLIPQGRKVLISLRPRSSSFYYYLVFF